MNILQPIHYEELTETDIVWLLKALRGNYGGYAPVDIVREIQQGLPHTLWRIRAPAQGIMVTTELSHPAGKELLIWWLAGKRVLRNLSTIYAELEETARIKGCRWVSGAAQKLALGRWCQRRLRVTAQDTLYTIEVNYGRTATGPDSSSE